MYRCDCKYTGSAEVKEPDWKYVRNNDEPNKSYWTGEASLGDGYECTVKHFRNGGKETLETDVPEPFLNSPDIVVRRTIWTDAKEGFEYEFYCEREEEVKTVPPDWKLNPEKNLWEAGAHLSDGWDCDCEAKPIKTDNK